MVGGGSFGGILGTSGASCYKVGSKGCEKGDKEANLANGSSDRELVIREVILPRTNAHTRHQPTFPPPRPATSQRKTFHSTPDAPRGGKRGRAKHRAVNLVSTGRNPPEQPCFACPAAPRDSFPPPVPKPAGRTTHAPGKKDGARTVRASLSNSKPPLSSNASAP